VEDFELQFAQSAEQIALCLVIFLVILFFAWCRIVYLDAKERSQTYSEEYKDEAHGRTDH
jgi:hypothetical protein